MKNRMILCLFLMTFSHGAFANNESPALRVYSSQKEHIVKPVLDAFSKETQIPVEFHFDNAGPLLEKLKSKPNGDVLFTVDVGNLWLAEKSGLLLPIQSNLLNTHVPENLRSPDGKWFGFSMRARTIVYDPRHVKAEDLKDYADLANTKWKGQVCLRTSQHVYNQSLVGMLIEDHGLKSAEKIVSGWVQNLATSPYSSDTQLLEAMAQGVCKVGISNSYYLARLKRDKKDFPIKIHWPPAELKGVHVNIFGGGVLKSSKNPDLAQKLLEWLTSPVAQKMLADANLEFPVRKGVDLHPIVKAWGDFKPNSNNLIVSGKRQAEAVRLMDRAKFK